MPAKPEKETSPSKDEDDLPSPRWDVITHTYEDMNEVYIKSVETNKLSVFERKIIMMMLDNSVELDKINSMMGFLMSKGYHTTADTKGNKDIYR